MKRNIRYLSIPLQWYYDENRHSTSIFKNLYFSALNNKFRYCSGGFGYFLNLRNNSKQNQSICKRVPYNEPITSLADNETKTLREISENNRRKEKAVNFI